jgi:hypothetical protein
MSNPFKFFTTSICLAIGCIIVLVTGSCNLLPISAPTQYKESFQGRSTFHVNARPGAGIQTIADASLAYSLDTFLQKISVKKGTIVTARLDSLVFIIPDTSRVDFTDFVDAKLVLKTVPTNLGVVDSVSIPFPNVTGKVNKLIPVQGLSDGTYDVSRILNAPGLSCIAYFRTRRATPYTTIYFRYHFELSFNEQL